MIFNDNLLKNLYSTLKYMKKIDGWRKWAVAEGLTKTASRTFQKVAGTASNNWGGAFLVAGIIGFVQVASSLIIISKNGERIFGDLKGMFGSILFGLLALTSTVFGIATFLYGGDISTSTFIVTLSIVPGMMIDIIFFKYQAKSKEWLGIVVAILAGWAVLDFPRLNSLSSFPTWVWFAFGTMMTVAINQGITQSVRKVSPMFKNFWGGMVALVGAPIAMFMIGEEKLLLSFFDNKILWFTSATIGFIVIAMWSFNLLSYKEGASIALKKLVMNGTYLLSTMILGNLIFHEEITTGKWTAIPLFLIAYVLMDKKAYDFIFSPPTSGKMESAR